MRNAKINYDVFSSKNSSISIEFEEDIGMLTLTPEDLTYLYKKLNDKINEEKII